MGECFLSSRSKRKHGVSAPSLVAVLASLAAVSPASAQEAETAPNARPMLQWSGFGTLGLTQHDNTGASPIFAFSQKAPARSGLSANLDSVLGVQLDVRPLEGTSVTLQAVARAGDELEPKVRMAYVRQQLGQDGAVRLGRIRSPFYLDSDVSEIGFAYLLTRPALPLYNVAANNVPHVDGGDIQWRYSAGSAALLVQGFAGSSGYQHIFYNLEPAVHADAKFRGIKGLALSLSLPDVTFRASRTWVDEYSMRSSAIDQINSGLTQMAGGLALVASNPYLPDVLRAGLATQAKAIEGYVNPFDNRPIYTSLGFDATYQSWRLLGEWAVFDSRSAMVGRYRGYQATVAYTLGDFTPYLTSSRNDRLGSPMDTSALHATGLDPTLDGGLAAMQSALNRASQFANLSARSTGLGLRWDCRDNVALKFQYDRMKTPSVTSPGVFAVPSLPFRNSINLFSATLDFVF